MVIVLDRFVLSYSILAHFLAFVNNVKTIFVKKLGNWSLELCCIE